MIQCATLWVPEGMKNVVSISIVFCLDFLIRNENITSVKYKTKNPLRNNIACRVSYKPSKLGG